jgi:hypothetical protein
MTGVFSFVQVKLLGSAFDPKKDLMSGHPLATLIAFLKSINNKINPFLVKTVLSFIDRVVAAQPIFLLAIS